VKYLRSRPVLLLLAAALVGLLAWILLTRGSDPDELTRAQFDLAVDRGDIDPNEATLKDRSNKVTGDYEESSERSGAYVFRFAGESADEVAEAYPQLDVDTEKESIWVSIAWSLLPMLFLVGIFIWFISSMQGGGSKVMQFGKSKARRFNKDEPTVTFEDVAGVDEAVQELQEVREFLQEPGQFTRIGARVPKGVLLYGPPGTGKTLLARAVAGEAGVPFFSISGSDFVEMFVGVGASRVRDLFNQAKAAGPSIVFVDEIDAVGRHRGAGLGGGHDEREQTLNQLLVEMDGFDESSGVILVAATNRPDILDPALLRPGRFDRQIVVDAPDLDGRRQILRVHSKEKPLAPDVDLDIIARRTPGFTGADLANLMNEAAILAAREDYDEIHMDEVSNAIDRVIAGPERKNRLMSDREKRVVAYHEAGHALVGHVLPNTDPIHKVSIIARGRALGWTLSLPLEDRYLKTRSELRDQLTMLLGGRTAEEVIFGDPTTGAADDIERASQIARAMVTKYGMSERIGLQQLGRVNGEVFLGKEMAHEPDYSDDVAGVIDDEVRRIIDAAHTEAREILTLHRSTLDRLADMLVEQESVEEDELIALFEDPADVAPEAEASVPVSVEEESSHP
jgi:cell division protease FtsH